MNKSLTWYMKGHMLAIYVDKMMDQMCLSRSAFIKKKFNKRKSCSQISDQTNIKSRE